MKKEKITFLSYSIIKIICVFIFVFFITGCKDEYVKINAGENAQTEIIYRNHRVLLDIWNPKVISKKKFEKEYVIASHFHEDHYEKNFYAKCTSDKLLMTPGTFKDEYFSIDTIGSSHTSYYKDGITPSNCITLIQVQDIKIGHFGDLGQEFLTNEQITTFGKIDIAILPVLYTFNDTKNLNDVIVKLKPSIIIPTHYDLENLEILLNGRSALFTGKTRFKFSKKNINPLVQKVIIYGELSSGYRKQLLH